MLGKFADLPREAEEEIRDLDGARRRIAELERQIEQLKETSAAPRRPLSGSAAWERKLDQSRARIRQMAAAAALTEQALVRLLKALFEEAQREPLAGPVSDRASASVNRRPEREMRRARERVAPTESLNGTSKLSSGERKIMTALAQYPQGRSKAQVAVLTGYAATGGGFNNYLGSLRSRGRKSSRSRTPEFRHSAHGSRFRPVPC